MKLYSPVVEYLHLQIRFNLRTRAVEIKTSDQTEDIQALQKGGEQQKSVEVTASEKRRIFRSSGFHQSIHLRFRSGRCTCPDSSRRSLSRIVWNQWRYDAFEIRYWSWAIYFLFAWILLVKPLKGDNLSRAIGRIAGKNGRTKFAIENATRCRIVLAEE